MIRLTAGVFEALFSGFRKKKPGRRRRGSPASRQWTSFGQLRGGERLEWRSMPSANPIVATPLPVSGFENQPLTNVPVASFTDGNGSEPATNFHAAIVWGDGATSTGTVIESGTNYIVVVSHTYTDINDNPVIVGIQDTTNATANALVTDTGSIAPLLPDGTQGTADQRYVYEVLKDTLQRPITMTDVNYWTSIYENNHSDRQTFNFILLEATPPYEYRRGEIDNAYKTYLHRAADPQGEDYFLQLVIQSTGAHSGPGTEKRTSALLINSDEYYFQRAGGTLDGFITAVYEDALKRAPDPGGLAYFEYQLTHGMTHIEFATTILNSTESLTRSINNLYERYLGRPADPGGIQQFLVAFNTGYGTESNTETILDTDEFYNRAVGLPLNTVD